MPSFGAFSIKAKLGLLVALASGSALILACTVFGINDFVMLRQTMAQHFTAVADVLGANTVAALTFSQPEPAEEVLSSLRFEPQVEFAGIYDAQGRLFARYERQGLAQLPPPAPQSDEFGCRFRDDGRLQIAAQIRDPDGPVGSLVLLANMDHLYVQLRQHGLTAAIVLAASLGASQLASSLMQKRIAGPILVLAETAERISAERDYSVRVEKTTEDELGTLYDAFNRMLNEIQEGERQLQQARNGLEQRVIERTQQLTDANRELARQVAERQLAEQTLRELQERHLEAARRAGMTDVATGVLHNVGNVLNSVNVSVSLARDKLRNSPVSQLGRAVSLMTDHRQDLPAFLTADERGKRLPAFLSQLSSALLAERDATLEELESLEECVEHIKEVVNTQQTFAARPNWSVSIRVADLMDDAVKLNDANLLRHGITLVKDYEDVGEIVTDRHKVLQILINLLSNAKHALKASNRDDREITLRVRRAGADRVRLSVADNGIGIPPENLNRIFNHGFTTKKRGHGFGLHSAALAAAELGGTLSVVSDGPGRGACFSLELPVLSVEPALCPA